MDMGTESVDENDQVRYVLAVVCMFSSFVWTYMLKNKDAESVLRGIKSIYKRVGKNRFAKYILSGLKQCGNEIAGLIS